MLNTRFFYTTALFAVLLALAAMLGYFEENQQEPVPGIAEISPVAEDEFLAPQPDAANTYDETGDPAREQASAKSAPDTALSNPPNVERSIDAALGDDPDARAAAIGALALAPKAQALPVLQKILNAGIDADRQFALNSLHTLALREGDSDGEIQNVLRLSIYDGDDTIALGAQIVLEEIERNTDRLTAGINR